MEAKRKKAPKGTRKPAKRNKERSFSLNLRLQQMLLARRPEDYNPEEIVFPSPEGSLIDVHNFANRPWKAGLQVWELSMDAPITAVTRLPAMPSTAE